MGTTNAFVHPMAAKSTLAAHGMLVMLTMLVMMIQSYLPGTYTACFSRFHTIQDFHHRYKPHRVIEAMARDCTYKLVYASLSASFPACVPPPSSRASYFWRAACVNREPVNWATLQGLLPVLHFPLTEYLA